MRVKTFLGKKAAPCTLPAVGEDHSKPNQTKVHQAHVFAVRCLPLKFASADHKQRTCGGSLSSPEASLLNVFTGGQEHHTKFSKQIHNPTSPR